MNEEKDEDGEIVEVEEWKRDDALQTDSSEEGHYSSDDGSTALEDREGTELKQEASEG